MALNRQNPLESRFPLGVGFNRWAVGFPVGPGPQILKTLEAIGKVVVGQFSQFSCEQKTGLFIRNRPLFQIR